MLTTFFPFSHKLIIPVCICLVDFDIFNSTVCFYNLSRVDSFAFQGNGKDWKCYLDISISMSLAGDF